MIEVIFSNPHDYVVDLSALQRVVSRVFLANDVTIARVGVHLVDETKMKHLNENYKHHQGATDVLSFVMHDPEQPTPTFLETEATKQQYGDIFLCVPVIEQEVLEQQEAWGKNDDDSNLKAADSGSRSDFSSDFEDTNLQSQVEFLLEHGCLHLLGHHHD